jgi:hypothetical protein
MFLFRKSTILPIAHSKERIKMMSNQETPTYRWDVRIEDSLRVPVTMLAINKGREIRQVVSDAVRDYLKKQKTKAGER